jgi:hypothetical protein
MMLTLFDCAAPHACTCVMQKTHLFTSHLLRALDFSVLALGEKPSLSTSPTSQKSPGR